MTVRAFQRALLGLVLLAPSLASAENARLPYREICRAQQAQATLARDHPNLELVLTLGSTLTNVNNSDIHAFIDAKSGPIPVPVEANGAFSVPVREDLQAENPWIIVNQPRWTVKLHWHAGLSRALARTLAKSFHYGPLMRAVRECDDVQEKMRQFDVLFPDAPRLTTVGLKMVFRQPGATVIIHAKSGGRKLVPDASGELLIPLDEDLLAEDPLVTLTAPPVEMVIAMRKSDSRP